jgi:hypothetical protein
MPVIQVSAFLSPVSLRIAADGYLSSRGIFLEAYVIDIKGMVKKEVRVKQKVAATAGKRAVHRGKVSRLRMWHSGDGHGLEGGSDTGVRH